MGMNTPDDFSQYHAELLDGIYDCVDRIVLNAFFPLGQTAGGMRSWWRSLHDDDSQLDDKHLREMAGTFARRLHAFCAKQGIPIIEARSGERKHELAEPHMPKDPTFSGLFLVITGNAPAPILRGRLCSVRAMSRDLPFAIPRRADRCRRRDCQSKFSGLASLAQNRF